jgi:uncharacterized membrane protein YjjB (DUF3815 family)
MGLSTFLMNSLWAALFAAALGVLLTAPVRYLVATFACGFSGRFVRDVCIGWGLTQDWSTVIAAAVVAVLAGLMVWRSRVSPVVLVCAVLPLGAAGAMLNMIYDLMRVSFLKRRSARGRIGNLERKRRQGLHRHAGHRARSRRRHDDREASGAARPEGGMSPAVACGT